jgi:hypothetical protein
VFVLLSRLLKTSLMHLNYSAVLHNHKKVAVPAKKVENGFCERLYSMYLKFILIVKTDQKQFYLNFYVFCDDHVTRK